MGPDGYAVQYVRGLVNEKYICLIELHYQGDGDGGSYEENRLYVLNRETGELILRQNTDYERLISLRNDEAIIFENGEASAYHVITGEVTHHWSETEGFEQYPELKSGISEISSSDDVLQNSNNGWLLITAKNGIKYCLNLLTNDLLEMDYPPRDYNKIGFSCDEYEVKYTDSLTMKRWYYNFIDSRGDLSQLKFNDTNYQEKILDGEYIDPKMLAVFPDLNLFIFKHAETTDKINYFFTAVNFNHELVWQHHQDKFLKEDNHTDEPAHGLAIPYNNDLILTFGGAVVTINPANGDVIWANAY